MKTDYSQKLEEFTKHLKKIPEITAVYFTGSTAKKSWNEYSDLDIDLVVKEKNYNKIVKQLPKLLGWWGKIKLINYYKGCDETYAFIGKDYLKVEIEPIKEKDLGTKYYPLNNIRIAFDKTGLLTKKYKRFRPKKAKLDHKDFVHLFLDTRSNFLYIVRHYVRGQKLSGASELNKISGELFYHLGILKGLEGWENIRTAEKHLTKKEWNFLKISSCKSLKRSEIKRWIDANWLYLKYIEDLYEKKSKRKLNLKCNDKEIKNIINNTLK